uniref:Perilipin n=1 Tax=Arion vulgaris TaxID=1028688 RepID=A0A0B7AKY7_9EUPU
MPSDEQFLNKLGEIPVLNDGWNTALSYYARVKDYNSLTKFALDATESGVKKAAAISTPVISHFQPQIDSVNDYACNTLEAIEKKYPVVKQPSKEIKEACVEYVQPVVGRVKPVVTYVQGVVDNSKKKVERVKTCGTNLVAGARDLGVNTVSSAVNVTLNTPPGRLMTRTVDGVLSFSEGLVDKYIPEEPLEESASEGDDSSKGSTETDEKVEAMEEMEPSPQRVVIHFRTVSKKLRERMFKRAMRDFRNAKVRTGETIGKLHSAVDLIDYAKTNLEAVRGKVEDLWTQIVDTDEKPKENNESSASSVEERIVLVGRTLAHQLRSGISALEKASNEAGQFVRHPITKSHEFTDFVYHLSSDFKNISTERIRSSLQAIQTKLKATIDNVDWMAVDIEMDGINMEEDNSSSTEVSEEETDTTTVENHI